MGRKKLNDRSTPNVVLAPDPDDRTKFIKLFLGPEKLRKCEEHADEKVNAKIGEYCGLIHGNCKTPANDKGLNAAIAICKGVKRPMLAPGVDKRVLIYIIDHPYTYTYPHDIKFGGVVPIRRQKPIDSLFAVYVLMNDDAEKIGCSILPEADGVLIKWEWVVCGKSGLPEDFDDRYDDCLWRGESL